MIVRVIYFVDVGMIYEGEVISDIISVCEVELFVVWIWLWDVGFALDAGNSRLLEE
jgi:hypothetical protein